MTNDERKRSWPGSVARGLALLRGLVLLAFVALLILVPEKVMPGSSSQPARSLALMVVSRTALLGLSLVVLTITNHRKALGWLLLADAALQVFDTGMAIATAKGAVAILPAAICALDSWAGLVLLRSARSSASAIA